MSRWSVAAEHAVGDDDLAQDGAISAAAMDRWAATAAATYLEQCLQLEHRRAGAGLVRCAHLSDASRGRPLGRAPAVVVSATATQVLPNAFVIAIRIRPIGAESSDPVDLTCEVRLEDPSTGVAQELGNDIRDELIALEHAARHFN